jgi:type 1 glutamine amidotransferase
MQDPRPFQQLVAWMLGILLVVAGTSPARAGKAAGESPQPLKVVMAVGPNKDSLAKFRDHLRQRYHVEVTWIEAQSGKEVPGVEALESCDVLLLNLRRTRPTPGQLKLIKNYFAQGKPVVGLRRGHHGFENWLEADREVFGVKYGGHGGGGQDAPLRIPDDQKDNPLLAGVRLFMPGGGLYDHSQLDPKATVLMQSLSNGKSYPQMWTLVRDSGQRVFYTRFDPSDVVKDEGVREMVIRALFWTAERDPDKYRRD